MAERKTVILHNAQQAAGPFGELRDWCRAMLAAGHKLTITAKPETRSDGQNRLLWAMLMDISRQVVWHGMKLSPEDWKHMFSSQIHRMRSVPNFDNTGFIILGQSTSKMTRSEMSDLIELMTAFGVEHGVKFTAPDYE